MDKGPGASPGQENCDRKKAKPVKAKKPKKEKPLAQPEE